MSERCADLSFAAGEPLGGTATTARRWLLVEVPGSWPRDVGDRSGLPDAARDHISAWLAQTEGSRLQFIRRPQRPDGSVLAFVIRSDEDRRDVRRIELESLAGLAELDLEAAGDLVAAQLVLVCGHGSRDACCVLHGTAVFDALRSRLGDEELWISSHQGGHRFAANVLVLPAGLQFGRVTPEVSPFLVARALAGRIELDHFRGRTCYGAVVQAADLAIRAAAGIDGVDELRLEDSDVSRVRFRSWTGELYEVSVEEELGPLVPSSCGMDPEPQRVLNASIL